MQQKKTTLRDMLETRAYYDKKMAQYKKDYAHFMKVGSGKAAYITRNEMEDFHSHYYWTVMQAWFEDPTCKVAHMIFLSTQRSKLNGRNYIKSLV